VATPLSRPGGGRLNQDIANAIVRCHKRFLGRGPTKAQSFFRHNFVVVVLEIALTEAERRLAGGDRDAVLWMRLRYEQTMREELVAVVEQLTGCRVEALLTANHITPDLAVDVFVLDRPVPGEPATACDPVDGPPRPS
jgi:uncharacterized protein YbcI